MTYSRGFLSGILAAELLVAACGTDRVSSLSGSSSSNATPANTTPPSLSAKPPTPAAEPARAPTPTVPPTGKVVPIADTPEGVVVGSSGAGAVAVRNPDGIVLFDAATGAVRQRIPTSGSARHLELAGPDGPVLVPLEASNELSEVTLNDGHVISTATGVGRQPHDAALTSGGTVVVTSEIGGGVVFVRDGNVVGSLPAGPIQPGGVAAVGKYAVVADVQGNGVWVYDGTTRQLVAQAPVGVKLTHAVGLSADLAAFADTDGGAVLIDRIDPQITQAAKVDAPGNPYGLAYDAQRRRLFVTLTASNILRVIDLADPGRPRVLGGVPTVQQPNSVAVDPRSGAVLVTGSGPDGSGSLQIVSADQLPAA